MRIRRAKTSRVGPRPQAALACGHGRRAPATSKSPGLTVFPVSATLTAWMRVAAFTPRSLATARRAASVARRRRSAAREDRAEREKMVGHSLHTQMLGRRRWVVLHGVDEEESAEVDELIQPLRPRLQQLEHREEPRVPFCQIRVVPHACGLEGRPPPSRAARRARDASGAAG